MNLLYLEDKSDMVKAVWEFMEDFQDNYIHYRIGWWGFIPMFFE